MSVVGGSARHHALVCERYRLAQLAQRVAALLKDLASGERSPYADAEML
jgi:hypothetical protein